MNSLMRRREKEEDERDEKEHKYPGFPTRMVYPYYISCLRYTILVGNPRYILAVHEDKWKVKRT